MKNILKWLFVKCKGDRSAKQATDQSTLCWWRWTMG